MYCKRHYQTAKSFFTWKSMALLLARSALFPASAITMFGLACRWSSFTQFFARVNVSFKTTKQQLDIAPLKCKSLMFLKVTFDCKS